MHPRLCTVLGAARLLGAVRLPARQANVNLDGDPPRNAEGLVPYSAPLNSPQVHAGRTVTFRVQAPPGRSSAARTFATRS